MLQPGIGWYSVQEVVVVLGGTGVTVGLYLGVTVANSVANSVTGTVLSGNIGVTGHACLLFQTCLLLPLIAGCCPSQPYVSSRPSATILVPL